MSSLMRYSKIFIGDQFEEEVISNYATTNNEFYDNNLVNCWLPSIDINTYNKLYIVKICVPGLEKNNINIYTNQYNSLIIEGKKGQNNGTKQALRYCEKGKRIFAKRISFPEFINIKDIKAKYKNNYLRIIVPKLEIDFMKKIEVEEEREEEELL